MNSASYTITMCPMCDSQGMLTVAATWAHNDPPWLHDWMLYRVGTSKLMYVYEGCGIGCAKVRAERCKVLGRLLYKLGIRPDIYIWRGK
jgi:hypothetical protein